MKTGPGIDYSLTFAAPLEQLSSTKPRKLRVQAWAWVPDETSATTLVVEVAGAGGTVVVWEGIQLGTRVKSYGSWQHIEETVMLNPRITSDDVFKVYLWRRDGNNTSVYLDDLIIAEEE